MAEYTSALNLEKPLGGENIRRQVINDNMDKIDTAVKDLRAKLDNGVKNTVQLNWGMNTIKHNGDTPIFPYIRVKGKHYVNLLGKDGNCEDVSKWLTGNSTLTLDSSDRVFGINSLKVTNTAVNGYLYAYVSDIGNYKINKSKYYLVSFYIKNGTCSKVRVGVEGTGSISKYIDTTAPTFTRIGIKIMPADFGTNQYLFVMPLGACGVTGYVDGIMINEISADEYNNFSVDQLLGKYPYIDSVQGLKNLSFENRRYNLVDNGNTEKGLSGWSVYTGTATGSASIENGKFKLVSSTSGYGYIDQYIKVKANTSYCLTSNVSGATTIFVTDSAGTTTLRSGSGTFNTGNNTVIRVLIENYNVIGTGYADSIMLVEGTTAPTEYKSCEIERFTLDTELWNGDVVEIKGSKVSGMLNWKHKTLYGKDFNWQYSDDFTGFKRIYINAPKSVFANCAFDTGTSKLVKYDGKIIPEMPVGGQVAVDQYSFNLTNSSVAWLAVNDNDSGWLESVATVSPNDDEVKVFMNGWKAVINNNGRYGLWISAVDNSLPAVAVTSTTTATYSAGTTTIVVADGSKFSQFDYVAYKLDNGTWEQRQISNVSSNTLTLNVALSGSLTSGASVTKTDTASGGVATANTLVTWCKNNIAPNYQGYQLHYKLANPEPITGTNVPIMGDWWALVDGENYVTVDSGIVLGEVAKPALGGGYYCIGWTGNITPSAYSPLKYTEQDFLAVYKNGVNELPQWTIDKTQSSDTNYIYIVPSKYDVNATYTVDYRRLYEEAPQSAEELHLEFMQGIVQSVESIAKAVEGTQKADNALDCVVARYMNKRISLKNCPTFIVGTQAFIEFYIPINDMACVPRIVSYKLLGWTNGTDIVPYLSLVYASPTADKSNILIQFSTSDANIVNSLKTYGTQIAMVVVLSCEGRI